MANSGENLALTTVSQYAYDFRPWLLDGGRKRVFVVFTSLGFIAAIPNELVGYLTGVGVTAGDAANYLGNGQLPDVGITLLQLVSEHPGVMGMLLVAGTGDMLTSVLQEAPMVPSIITQLFQLSSRAKHLGLTIALGTGVTATMYLTGSLQQALAFDNSLVKCWFGITAPMGYIVLGANDFIETINYLSDPKNRRAFQRAFVANGKAQSTWIVAKFVAAAIFLRAVPFLGLSVLIGAPRWYSVTVFWGALLANLILPFPSLKAKFGQLVKPIDLSNPTLREKIFAFLQLTLNSILRASGPSYLLLKLVDSISDRPSPFDMDSWSEIVDKLNCVEHPDATTIANAAALGVPLLVTLLFNFLNTGLSGQIAAARRESEVTHHPEWYHWALNSLSTLSRGIGLPASLAATLLRFGSEETLSEIMLDLSTLGARNILSVTLVGAFFFGLWKMEGQATSRLRWLQEGFSRAGRTWANRGCLIWDSEWEVNQPELQSQLAALKNVLTWPTDQEQLERTLRFNLHSQEFNLTKMPADREHLTLDSLLQAIRSETQASSETGQALEVSVLQADNKACADQLRSYYDRVQSTYENQLAKLSNLADQDISRLKSTLHCSRLCGNRRLIRETRLIIENFNNAYNEVFDKLCDGVMPTGAEHQKVVSSFKVLHDKAKANETMPLLNARDDSEEVLAVFTTAFNQLNQENIRGTDLAAAIVAAEGQSRIDTLSEIIKKSLQGAESDSVPAAVDANIKALATSTNFDRSACSDRVERLSTEVADRESAARRTCNGDFVPCDDNPSLTYSARVNEVFKEVLKLSEPAPSVPSAPGYWTTACTWLASWVTRDQGTQTPAAQVQ